MKKHQCKDCGEDDVNKFYMYSYIRAGLLVRKPMGRCRQCLKVHRVRRSMAKENEIL